MSKPFGANDKVIRVPVELWRRIYDELAPLNRLVTDAIDRPNFLLFSLDGNRIAFIQEAK